MSKNQKTNSIDQFYADKFNDSPLDLSADASWDLFEAEQSKPKFSWSLDKKMFVFSLLVLSGISIAMFMWSGTSDMQQKSLSSIQSTESVENESQNRLNTNSQLLTEGMDASQESIADGDARPSDRIAAATTQDNRSSVKSQASNSSLETKINESNFNSKNTYITTIQKVKNYSKNTKIISDSSNTNASKSNNKPSSINYEKTIDQTSQGATTLLGGSPRIGSGLTEGSVSDQRSLLTFDLLTGLQVPLLQADKFLAKPEIIQIVSKSKRSRWAIDLGFSLNKEYELSDNFSLETVSNRLRVSHLSLGYAHLTKRYFTTRAYVSYDKIYGTEEFVGQRIVRTYADDNLSLGYGINLKLTRRLGLESSLSFGMSFIDKIELEQKPIWVDGKREYKDYTKSTFTMDPTLTYQSHTKLTYQLPYGLDIFAGGTYRSQFATKLSSSQTTRENTLDKFADLQFTVGLRYHIK